MKLTRAILRKTSALHWLYAELKNVAEETARWKYCLCLTPVAVISLAASCGSSEQKEVVFCNTTYKVNATLVVCTHQEAIDLSPLAGLSALSDLRLSGTHTSDLTSLAGFTNLDTLYLKSTHVSDLAPLAGLTKLERLDLEGTKVTDLRALAGLSRLKRLDLTGTQISDITPLAGLSSLESLELSDTQISDIAPLAGLTNLERLRLSGTKITVEQAGRLNKALPGCDIDIWIGD